MPGADGRGRAAAFPEHPLAIEARQLRDLGCGQPAVKQDHVVQAAVEIVGARAPADVQSARVSPDCPRFCRRRRVRDPVEIKPHIGAIPRRRDVMPFARWDDRVSAVAAAVGAVQHQFYPPVGDGERVVRRACFALPQDRIDVGACAPRISLDPAGDA